MSMNLKRLFMKLNKVFGTSVRTFVNLKNNKLFLGSLTRK